MPQGRKQRPRRSLEAVEVHGTGQLMPHHVHEILLVSSLYDSFTLSEDGKLSDLIMSEFLDMNLRHTPGVTQVSTGREALQLARANPRLNLIFTSLQVGDMDSLELARRV